MPTTSSNPIGAFIVGRSLAETAGLSSSQANQWGGVLMATGLSPASILLVSELARLDAARLSEPLDHSAQLRDPIQLALQKAEAAAESADRAVALTEQEIARLDQLSDRMAKLELLMSQPSCSKETCEEILATLRRLGDDNNFCGLKPSSRRSRCGRRFFRWLGRLFRKVRRGYFWRDRKSTQPAKMRHRH